MQPGNRLFSIKTLELAQKNGKNIGKNDRFEKSPEKFQ